MRTILTVFTLLLSVTFVIAQDDNILKTETITIDEFIGFIANNFPIKPDYIFDGNKVKKHQLTFLLETTVNNYSLEDKTRLQQAFKFLISRLTQNDTISLLLYGEQNGLLLDNTKATDLKKILFALDDVKNNTVIKADDGIEMAYQKAQDNLQNSFKSTVIMVRNPNVENTKNTNATAINFNQSTITNPKIKTAIKPKPGNNIVLLTAISLLPEIISIIKK